MMWQRDREHRGPFPARFATTMIEEGEKAPDFDLETDDGGRVSLDSLKGRNVVLFFYPKDNTSG
jgi:peroxiredoxin